MAIDVKDYVKDKGLEFTQAQIEEAVDAYFSEIEHENTKFR